MKTTQLSRLMQRSAIGALIAAASAAPAFAQDAEAPAPAATAAEEVGDIVVTAQRRAERLQDVPISVTALSAETLTQGGAQSLVDIGRMTPGVRFDQQSAFAQPTIRGVGSSLVGGGVGSNVGIYIDGFYAPLSVTADFQLLNVSSIQVLKGPQGTLFGRNTTGGAVLVSTSEPSTDTRFIGEASYGRWNALKLQGYATTGLSDNVAVDIAALYRSGDGYVKNIATGSDKDGEYETWQIRAGVKVQMSDTAKLILRYTHTDNDDPTTVTYGVRDGLTSGNVIPGNIIATRPHEVSNSIPTTFHSKADIVQLTAEFDLDFATLTSYTQYRHERSVSIIDFDSTPAPVSESAYATDNKIFTQEIVLASQNSGSFSWTTGLFYYHDKDRFPYFSSRNGTNTGPFFKIFDTKTNNSAFAAFADGTYQVTDNLYLTAGLRYSKDWIRNPGWNLLGTVTEAPNRTFSAVTPRAVIRYEIDPATSTYLSWTRGSKSGFVNVSGFDPTPVRPEKIDAFEVGFKHITGALSFDASAYYYDYRNLQVASFIAASNVVRNAASSEIYGAEAQLRYAVTPNFEINGGAAYTHARFKTFTGASRYVQCLDVVTCGPNFSLFVLTPYDASGGRMPRSPSFSGNIGFRFDTDLAAGELAISGNMFYTSRVYFDAVEQFSQGAYALLNARVEWTDPSERYTLAAFVDNITDKDYVSQVLPITFGIPQTWGQPRSFGVSVRVKM